MTPEVLYDGSRTRVLRDVRDGQPVVRKQLRGSWPTSDQVTRLQREHDLLQEVDGHGAPRVIGLEVGEVTELVLEDVGGRALSSWMREARASATVALRTALRIAEALAAVHARGILHRDINPSNLVVEPESARVWLVDFDLASPVATNRMAPRPVSRLEGTPPYMAPEQTGRMNRAVDARSDLYALGVTLYELFGGAPPFASDDILGYVHAHLALQPPGLQPVVPDLPEAAIALVMTLLSKSPEHRYQSAAGVAADLAAIFASLGSEVTLRRRAVSDRPELPQELVGRESDVARLQATFDEVRQGGRHVVLVTGEGGIGKTSLVHELYAPVTIAGGRLLEGKFNEFSRDVPFSALTHILEAFAADVLAGPVESVNDWRDRLLAATAPNAALLSDLSPRLETLLGPQPPAPDIEPSDGLRRLQETVRRAVKAVATPEHALVVFLDDLQWADTPTLRLLEGLLRDPDLGHLLLVGAYRDNEIGQDHALRATLQAFESDGVPVSTLHLGPLEQTHITRLLARAMDRPDVGDLAWVLGEKTGGNPFFLRRIVEEAGRTGALCFDSVLLRWDWDLDAIQRLAPADNVIALLGEELGRLDEAAQACLAAGAIVGGRFGMDDLVTATGLDRDVVRKAIAKAIRGRFVQPTEGDYWDGARHGFHFAFVHDRVQEAAAELSRPEDRPRVHLAIARALAQRDDGDPFSLAEHYGKAVSAIDTAEERAAAFAANLEAGRRALGSAAHAPAHTFLGTALALAPDAHWTTDREGARQLWSLAARTAWLVGDTALLNTRVERLRAEASDVVDRLAAEEVVVQAMIARGALHEAISVTLDVLATAGIALPRKPGADSVLTAVGGTLEVIGGTSLDALTARTADDRLELAMRRLLVRISSAAYVAEPNLLPLVACELVQRTAREGVSRESAYGFGVFSLCLSAGWMLEAARVQGETALELLRRFPDRALEGAVRHVVNHFTRIWSEPLRAIFDENPDVHRVLMDVGDLEYAGWVLHMRVVHGFFAGIELSRMAEEITHATATMEVHGVAAALHCTAPYRQLVANLVGEAEDPTRLVSEVYDESQALQALKEVDFRGAVLALSVAMLVARTFCGDTPGAVEALRLAMAYQDGALAMAYQAPMRVYGAIALLDLEGAAAVDEVLTLRGPVAAYAQHNPTAGAHLLALLDAEVARAEGRAADALEDYDRAIESAESAGLIHHEALANERAGRWHLARGSRRIARAYLLEARYAWQRWGSTARIDQLDGEFWELLAPAFHLDVGAQPTSLTSTHRGESDLDLASLLKASQAIASELDLEGLLTRSMQILIENVGATRGALLLATRGRLTVEAIGIAPAEVILPGGADPAESGLPLDIVRRVWRSASPEVHDDVSSTGGRARAVLCTCITHQGRPLGVLYFENDLNPGAFTDDRVRVLDVLAPQLAISVRNVRLQQAQDRFVPHQFLSSLHRDDIVDVQVGDHQMKEVSIFFSDIWGFTPIIEKLSAADALAFINRYLAHAEPEITGRGGFIDTYLGDGIMALFDAAGDNAQHAVAAAVGLHRAMERFNAERRQQGQVEVRTGVGINTGVVTMGTIGGQRSVKCGVVGDAVNLASRVEGFTRRTRSRLLVSDATFERLADPRAFTVRRTGRVRVKGREQPLTIYEVLDAEPESVRLPRMATRDRYEAALDAFFAGDFEGARDGWRSIAEHAPGDPVVDRMLDRVTRVLEHGVPSDWDDGIESLKEK